jgi:cyanophycinase
MTAGAGDPPVFLIGGGWNTASVPTMYGPLLRAAGPTPTIACIVLDEGDGPAHFQRWDEALQAAGACTPTPVLVAQDDHLDVAALDGADGVLVCGGLIPAYAHALTPARDALRRWLGGGRPFAGFSAGAAIAADAALVGGWRSGHVAVCPEDAGEDLDEVSVVPGIGLLPLTIDVHAAQWGTLTRLIEVVRRRSSHGGLAIDENTMLEVRRGRATVSGVGQVYLVTRSPTGVNVQILTSGEHFSIA